MRRRNKYVYSLGLVMSIFAGGCEEPPLEEVPAEVIGLWTTTAPRYADRAFEITSETVYLHQGGDLFATYGILRSRITMHEDQEPIYSLEYRDDSADEYSWEFYVSSEEGGTIRFTNQEVIVWRRNPDADVPWKLLGGGR